jgi:hypothetical protein
MRKALRCGLFLSLLLALFFPLTSCDSAGSGSGGSISFPSEGENGPNLLSEEFSGEIKTVSVSKDYSLAATTPGGDDLTVAFFDEGNWIRIGGTGWQSDSQSGDKGFFDYYLPEDEEGDQKIDFRDPGSSPDTTTLEIYKGSSTPNGSPDRTVKVTWGSGS